MRYEGIVYRPPSEAKSLIIQVTIGCARNNCRFCYMYKSKQFSIRPLVDIIEDLEMAKNKYPFSVDRIFLADGDALIMNTENLLTILAKIKELFPRIQRISAYGAPKDILGKSVEELIELKKSGLDLIYMGIESGNDQVLFNMEKGVTSKEIVEAGFRLRQAGIQLSVTLISGLGGRALLEQHALDSAKVISNIKPEYLSFLTLMVEEEAPLYKEIINGEFPLLSPQEVVREMRLFLRNVDSPGTIFRCNHASNYINLAGTLNTDIPSMLSSLELYESKNQFKPEEWRRL